jgi:DNA helicase II / ATP-dependent DNA helicase PcrA
LLRHFIFVSRAIGVWSDSLRSLTEPQREAVEHLDGPLLVLAGPGSGKTRVITHRVANLLRHGVPARQIVALTFTNKAADEMRSRVERLAPGEPVWMSTFHRFGARLLRQYAPLIGLVENYTIYDTSDSQRVLRRVLDELDINATLFSPEQIASGISWAKNNLITAEAYQPRPGNPLGKVVARVYPAYQARLLASGAVDFDDLLMHITTLLRDNPEVRATLDERFRYILVDEYQDTNLAQYTIVRALSIDAPNLAVTGDPDQSIYGWRGANLNNILNFENDYGNVRVVKLERNYRSTKRILRVADSLISYNQLRKQKALFTENEEGQSVSLVTYANQQAEAESIAGTIAAEVRAGRRRPRDFAIFYRVNALSRSFESALREEGVPYQIVSGVEFYQRREIKDLLAYLHLINNPRDDNAFLRIINTPPRSIGRTTIARLIDHANGSGITLLEAARQSGLIEALPKRAAVAVAKFVALYDRLSLHAAAPVEEIMGHVLAETKYQEALIASDDPEDQDRLANIQELLSAAREFDERHPGDGALEGFLEQSCLVNETDPWQAEDDKVTMMTLHAAKGLEFPVVFIVAVEQGLVPHERSVQSEPLIEEERRLLFVGITRARAELQMSLATHRQFRGVRRRTIPSQFLLELPRGEMNVVEPAWTARPEWETSEAADDDSWDVEALERESLAGASRKADLLPPLALVTAAEMDRAGTTEMRRVPPEAFHQGMMVRHPEYGLGKIVALSGSGPRRSATVAFFASNFGERRFMLAQSDLCPATSG